MHSVSFCGAIRSVRYDSGTDISALVEKVNRTALHSLVHLCLRVLVVICKVQAIRILQERKDFDASKYQKFADTVHLKTGQKLALNE